MPKLLMTGAKKYAKSTKLLLKEAEEKFDSVEYVPVNDIILKLSEDDMGLKFNGHNLKDFDYCLPRIDSKRAPHGYFVIKYMEQLGVKKPYKAEAIHTVHNKFSTLLTMKKSNIPMPATYLVSSINSAKKVLDKMNYPVVIKIVDSFGGAGVMMLDDKSSAKSAIETLKLLGRQIIIEEFLTNKGEDIRAFVVDGEIVASMKRVAKKGEMRANLFLGGRGEYISLKGEMEDVALRAAKTMGSDIIAIDLIESDDGPKVIEANLNPGIKGIQKITNINVSRKIIDFCLKQAE